MNIRTEVLNGKALEGPEPGPSNAFPLSTLTKPDDKKIKLIQAKLN